MKRRLAVLLCGLLILSLFGGCGAKPADNSSKKVLATINGTNIYEKDFEDWYLQFWGGSQGKEMNEELYEQFRPSYIQSYVEQMAVLLQAKADGISVSDDEITREIGRYQEQFKDSDGELNKEAYEADMNQRGFTEESLRVYLSNHMTLQALYAEISSVAAVSDAEVEAFYKDYQSQFHTPEMVKTKNIVVATDAEAREIIKLLDGGADFVELAVTRSIDESAVYNGGDIPAFAKDGPYVQSYKDASFAMNKPGEYTKTPVESNYGYHIILLEEKVPPKDWTFDEVKADIADQLLDEHKQELFAEYFDEVIETADIEIFAEVAD